MKRIVILFIVLMMLCGCNRSTPRDIVFDRCETSGVLRNLRSARIGDVVLFDCGTYGTYLKRKDNTVKKIKELSEEGIFKISSSDKYFYVSIGRREISGKIANVLVVDRKGNIIQTKDCECEWIQVYKDVIFGYYNGRDDYEEDVGWSAMCIEATHYISEDEFLEDKEDNIADWVHMTGEENNIKGKKMYRKKKDSDHEIPYYRDIPYYDAYDSLGYIVADGEIVSSLNEKKAKKYIVQLQEIMGKEEKNYFVASWQNSDKLYGVCRVYKKSGGFMQLFTKDIDYSFSFEYEPKTDSVSLIKKYDGIEQLYFDDNWIIYRKNNIIFAENLHTGKKKKIFKSDRYVWFDVSGDIVVVYDISVEEGKIKNKNAFILK